MRDAECARHTDGRRPVEGSDSQEVSPRDRPGHFPAEACGLGPGRLRPPDLRPSATVVVAHFHHDRSPRGEIVIPGDQLGAAYADVAAYRRSTDVNESPRHRGTEPNSLGVHGVSVPLQCVVVNDRHK